MFPTGPVKSVRPKVPPKFLVVVSIKVQVPLVFVTAEVSRVKVPLMVAVPAPVTLFAAAFVTINFSPPVLASTNEPPVLTVVLPVYVLTPDRVRAPVPETRMAPTPEITPAIFCAAELA